MIYRFEIFRQNDSILPRKNPPLKFGFERKQQHTHTHLSRLNLKK